MNPGNVQARGGGQARMSFRIKLTIVMMLVVSVVTGLAIYLAQIKEQAAYEQYLKEEFKSQSAIVFAVQDARHAEIAERCRALARLVRIRAALEENDVEDLYLDANDDLRDVVDEHPTSANARVGAPPRATFYCFLNPGGEILPAPKPKEWTWTNAGPWAAQIVKAGVSEGGQQIGYAEAGAAGIKEIVTTPIIGPAGEIIGALVLGFPPVESKPEAGIKTGICVDGELSMPELPAAEREALAGRITKTIGPSKPEGGNFAVMVGGEPCQLFYNILNPGSRFAPAYETSLYSLAGSQTEQRRLQWQIVGLGALVLLIGLAASHLFSASLSKPVEQLAVDSAQNLALREQAETELELTEQKYRGIFENAVEGIFLLSPDGKYLSANPAMARIFGYDSAAQFVAEAGGPDQKDRSGPGACKEFLRLAEANGFVSNFETRMCRRDGSEIWVSQNVRVVHGANGEVLHFEGTLEDITGRKQAVDSLREVNTELEKALADLKTTQQQVIQQERLRALGQMASGIAHDFNNALMPVSGFAELLLVDPSILDDKKKAAGYLEIIRTAAQDATNIVARLREFYRANEHSDVFTEVNLKRLAQQTISLTQPKWKNQAQARGAEIHIKEMLDDVPTIAGDESALREVLTNLIFNAVDAMAAGGTLTLRTFCEGERVCVEVSDTGAGMSDEVRKRCMEPFFSTKGERGTGLGLAMVFGIVQRHDGKIDLNTQIGQGTAFTISFPVRSIAPKAAAAGPARHQQALRVLVVDDEPQVRQVLTAFLTKEGHQVQTADDGVDGLRRFLDGKFDLVITDKAMPGMSGDQMAVAIKQFSPGMPIVLLSGFHTARDNEVLAGINVIATKPITLPALRETIDKAMQTA